MREMVTRDDLEKKKDCAASSSAASKKGPQDLLDRDRELEVMRRNPGEGRPSHQQGEVKFKNFPLSLSLCNIFSFKTICEQVMVRSKQSFHPYDPVR